MLPRQDQALLQGLPPPLDRLLHRRHQVQKRHGQLVQDQVPLLVRLQRQEVIQFIIIQEVLQGQIVLLQQLDHQNQVVVLIVTLVEVLINQVATQLQDHLLQGQRREVQAQEALLLQDHQVEEEETKEQFL